MLTLLSVSVACCAGVDARFNLNICCCREKLCKINHRPFLRQQFLVAPSFSLQIKFFILYFSHSDGRRTKANFATINNNIFKPISNRIEQQAELTYTFNRNKNILRIWFIYFIDSVRWHLGPLSTFTDFSPISSFAKHVSTEAQPHPLNLHVGVCTEIQCLGK